MKNRYFFTMACVLLANIASIFGQNNTISIPDVYVGNGKSISLPINMDNTADVVAVQFTLSVPEGLTLTTASASLTERSDGHTVTLRALDGGKYMAMIFSSENKPIKGRTGQLLSVTLNASNSLAEGTQLPLTLSDVVMGARDASNLLTGYSAGKVTIAKLPDLEVTEVVTDQSSLSPEGTVSVRWQVANIGELPTTAGWKEQIYLKNAVGLQKLLGTLYYDDPLEASGVISRNAELHLPAIIGLDGACRIVVALTANSNAGEPTWLKDNNTAQMASDISVQKVLALNPADASIDEAQTKNVRFQLTRSGDTNSDEVFALTHDVDSRLVFPESVSLLKGQSGTYFYAQVVADNVLDNDSIVNFSLSGNNYPTVSSKVNIEDGTFPSLSLTALNEEVTEGESIRFEIATQRASHNDIEVKMTCDAAKRFDIPSTIQIPAGQTSVEVTVEALEDDVPNVEEVVTFKVTAAKHNPASVNTVLVDNDVPTLQLEITPNALSEAAGPLAVTATLRRLDNKDKVVTVKLSDDSDGGIYYGHQTIVMEKGVEEAIVNLGPVDNALVDGERIYEITAAVWIASCSCNANSGTSGGMVSVPLTVYDNDGPTLTMKASSSVVKEGDEISVTLTRNTDTSNAEDVNISSDYETGIDFPNVVTIPAGETSTTFIVKPKGNEITDDGFSAMLTASADGFATGNIWFTVSDQTLPDAQITDMTLSADEVEVGGTITVVTKITNTGSYVLPELTKVGIYSSHSSTPLSTIYLQNTLPIGEEVVLTREVTMPATIGTFNIYAVVNDGNEVKELNYTNNSSMLKSVKTVSPYTVSIMADKASYRPGEKAQLSGIITGSKVAHKDVEIYILNDNYRHVITVQTDEDGKFVADYEPYPGQMGHFVAGACYPKEGLQTEMLTFDYYGVRRISNHAITCEALFGETYSSSFTLSNPGELPLSNVTVEVLSKPDNCDVSLTCPSTVEANSTFDIEYSIDATSVSTGNDWQRIELRLCSDEGASLQTTLFYYCRNKQGQLKADVTRIKTTMIKGTSRDYPLVITNTGKGETGRITMELPSWMSSVTPREMASLAHGDSTTVILRLTPTADMQLNVPISGSIGLNCTNGQGLSLPFHIEPVSESNGTLIIDVCDENTYYTTEKPHVAGASVTVSHPTTGAIVASGTTDENGRFLAILPEGYYAVNVSAPNHNSYRNNILIDPGVENLTTVNLSIEAITIDWRVEETTVQDEYSIVTTVKFETNVPVPVVELSMPKSIEAKSLPKGESLIFYATLTNKGLITAQDVQLLLPEGFHTLSFEALAYTEPFDLAPQQSVLIPVKVTHVAHNPSKSILRAAPIDDDPCIGQPGTLYFWDCGNDRKWHRYGIALQLGSCRSDDPSTWDNSGNGAYGGGASYGGPIFGPYIGGGGYYGSSSGCSNVSTHQDEDCEPCQNEFLVDLVDCGLQLVPVYRVLKQVIECVNSVHDLIDTTQDGDIREIAYGTLEATTSCIAARRAGTGDRNVSRQAERQQALEDILIALSSLRASQGQDELDGETVIETLGSLASSLAALAGWDFEYVEQIFCPLKFFLPCNNAGGNPAGSNSRKGKNEIASTPSYITEFRQNLAYPLIQQMTLIGVRHEFFGDTDWMDVDEEELFTFFDAFITSQNSEGIVNDNAYDTLFLVKPESISRDQVVKFVSRWNNTLSGNSNGPHFDCNKIKGYYDLIESIDSIVISKGFESVAELYEASYEKCKSIAEESKSVCSSISLQFSQKMVMTRQAFRGTLTVFNGNETTAMTDVKLSLVVKDENGNVATTHEFQINPETLTGFDGNLSLEEGWTLDAQQTGVATIMFIPTKYAAPMVERAYSFGGSLSYVDPFTGLTVTRDLSPVVLTVKPSPNLDLTYFMQRDIMGDDPLTEEIEPCEEAEFSLLINNIGYGDAIDVRMMTNQPEIIDNEKGLLVDFELMSSQLNGGEKTLALGGTVATDFGTIPAKSTSYAQWWIKSSLLGHFTDYDVEATHVTSYGNPDLSLLNEVSIHELIRSIDIKEDNNTLVGFIVNDIVDAEDTPDMLYLSNGEIESVSLARNVEIQKSSDTDYTMKVTANMSGWNYGSVSDPTYGVSSLKAVVRQSDGKEMPLRNFWQTDRTLRDGKDPLYENRIHFVDELNASEEETYILTFEPTPELLLEVAAIEGVPEEGSLSVEPVNGIKVVFNKSIDPSTFTVDDISLSVQGVKQDVRSVTLSTDDNKTFSLDFSTLNENAGNGYFLLTVNTSEISDMEGYNGKNGKNAGWIMYRDGLVALTTSAVPVSAGTIQQVPTTAKVLSQDAEQIEDDKAMYGTTVKLMTIPNEGYEFCNWTVNGEVVSDELAFEYVALSDMDIKANYMLKSYAVTLGDVEEGGSISGAASGVYTYGHILNLTVQTNDDYVFDGWIVNGENLGNNNDLSLLVNEAKEIHAQFKRIIFKQDITLTKGWNWVSSWISEPVQMSGLLSGVSHIVSQFDEIINDPVYGMIGGIEVLQPGLAYKVDASYASIKSFKGHIHDINDKPVELHKGWNWISYPYYEERNINEVISNPSEGEYLTSQFGFSEFADGYWEGTLTNLTPGYGYIYKSCTDKTLLFDFSEKASRTMMKRTTATRNDVGQQNVDVYKYPSTMNMIVQLSDGHSMLDNADYRIYAFAGNECRGESQYVGKSHYLTVYGDEATTITFVVEDVNSGNTYMAKEGFTFRQEVIGNRQSPYVITITTPTSVQDIEESTHRMTIYSIEGILISSDATIDTLKQLSRGIYIVDGQKFLVK